MEEEIRVKIETSLSTFNPGLLQDALNLSIVLEANGLSFGDIDNYLSFQRAEIVRQNKAFRKTCSKCGGAMFLEAVNTNARNQTGDSSGSVWTCSECLYQEFKTYTIKDRMNEMK